MLDDLKKNLQNVLIWKEKEYGSFYGVKIFPIYCKETCVCCFINFL